MRAAVFPVVGRLRFADDLEPSFSRHRLEQSLPFARFALVLALLLYALFGILDFYIVPVGARWIWVIRYVIFCPVALAVFGLTFTRWFRPVMQPILAGVAVLAGLGIVAMIAIAHPSAGYLYFCCLEAIQNASKHAGEGATLTLRLREDAGMLTFDVVDDGKGFDSQARGLGAGFLNMAHRLGALGGSLKVESAPQRGTTVLGAIPAGAHADAG